jgi:predicted negative regulator of RcsB-dependent stress response
LNNNRTIIAGAIVALLAVAGYIYWDASDDKAPSVPGATTTEPAKPK